MMMSSGCGISAFHWDHSNGVSWLLGCLASPKHPSVGWRALRPWCPRTGRMRWRGTTAEFMEFMEFTNVLAPKLALNVTFYIKFYEVFSIHMFPLFPWWLDRPIKKGTTRLRLSSFFVDMYSTAYPGSSTSSMSVNTPNYAPNLLVFLKDYPVMGTRMKGNGGCFCELDMKWYEQSPHSRRQDSQNWFHWRCWTTNSRINALFKGESTGNHQFAVQGVPWSNSGTQPDDMDWRSTSFKQNVALEPNEETHFLWNHSV